MKHGTLGIYSNLNGCTSITVFYQRFHHFPQYEKSSKLRDVPRRVRIGCLMVGRLIYHVRMAERSKALRSGRSPVFWAWVRIPLLTLSFRSIIWVLILKTRMDTSTSGWGGTRVWTGDRPICSRMLYHWAIPPTRNEGTAKRCSFSEGGQRSQSRCFREFIKFSSSNESNEGNPTAGYKLAFQSRFPKTGWLVVIEAWSL